MAKESHMRDRIKDARDFSRSFKVAHLKILIIY